MAAQGNCCVELMQGTLVRPVSRYPASVVTDESLKIASNRVRTTLARNAAAGDTILTAGDASRIVPQMLLSIGSEIVSVSSIDGNLLTVVRGFDGTHPACHAAGSVLDANIVAWHHAALAAEVKAIEAALGPGMSQLGDPRSGSINASLFNFAAQTPGVDLTGGVMNVVTLSPVPAGVNGTDIEHWVYISGGTGGPPEAVLITGGTAVQGAASGTIIFTPASNHTGTWQISTATGGIQEAICSLGPDGGDVEVMTDLTMHASVYKSGRPNVSVTRRPNALITGADWGEFAILGGHYSDRPTRQVFTPQSVVAEHGSTWDWESLTQAQRYNPYVYSNGAAGPYPIDYQNGASLGATVLGAVDIPSNTVGSGFVSGVSGMARTQNATQAVGLYGEGSSDGAGPADAVFGINALAMGRIQTNHVIGAEFDVMNSSAASQNVVGSYVVSDVDVRPTTEFTGYLVDVSAATKEKWNYGIHIRAGSCVSGGPGGGAAIRVAQSAKSGNSLSSMPVQFNSVTAAGTVMITGYQTDPNGVFIFGTPVAQPYKLLPFSANVTFNAATGAIFGMQLDSSITSSTLINAVAGQTLTFLFVQTPTGTRTVAWPANFKGAMTVDPGASKFSVQQFFFDGSTAYAVNAGVSYL